MDVAGETKAPAVEIDSGKTSHDSPAGQSDADATPTPKNVGDLPGSGEAGFSTRKNPFDDPAVTEHWRQVYEKSRYECRHVFDPKLTWTEEEEKRLVRKLDWHVCTWAVSQHNTICPEAVAFAWAITNCFRG